MLCEGFSQTCFPQEGFGLISLIEVLLRISVHGHIILNTPVLVKHCVSTWKGDHLGRLGAIEIFTPTSAFGYMPQGFFQTTNVYGHITLNTPVLVRSLKLSKVELC